MGGSRGGPTGPSPASFSVCIILKELSEVNSIPYIAGECPTPPPF